LQELAALISRIQFSQAALHIANGLVLIVAPIGQQVLIFSPVDLATIDDRHRRRRLGDHLDDQASSQDAHHHQAEGRHAAPDDAILAGRFAAHGYLLLGLPLDRRLLRPFG